MVADTASPLFLERKAVHCPKIGTLSVKQLNEDFIQNQECFEEAHTGLYNYNSKDTMDVYFTHASALLNDEMNLFDFLSWYAPLFRALVVNTG